LDRIAIRLLFILLDKGIRKNPTTNSDYFCPICAICALGSHKRIISDNAFDSFSLWLSIVMNPLLQQLQQNQPFQYSISFIRHYQIGL